MDRRRPNVLGPHGAAGFGLSDLLKTIDSRQRNTRFQRHGPGESAGIRAGHAADEYGLWLDSGPQEDDVDPEVYGRPSGIVGLRVYPNPKFDDEARKQWDANRYYSDPNYYNDPKLVRPYVVGMACGFCHVSFNPVKPPDDPEKPKWENLSSTIGNQYFNASRIFGNGAARRQLRVSAVSFLAARNRGHLVPRD